MLRNRGEDAYKPVWTCASLRLSDIAFQELYGNSIIVERTIRREGASGYKVKNAQDKTIASSGAEIEAILDHFNIQINNPISVLNQDMTKTFLNSSDDTQKYSFFMKATLLESIRSDYRDIQVHITTIHELIQTKKKVGLSLKIASN